ncbi:hypothetical protein AB1Y20_009591 [Prymnesium parvum]|uniref:Centrosomal protein of 70 kDa n=1 Tax=Prymnesium parvum TaxID=97485 RepID=A0AB34K4N8_PRYPA
MASSSGNGVALQASILRFVSAHEAVAERTAAQRQQWKRDAEAMNLQISAMEETIVLLEREVKHTTASLAKIEALDKRGGLSSGSTAADMELLLGQLEDKLTRTQADLEEARRATYFPFVEGYQLRFSYDKNYLGFRELLLEQLRGTLSLKLVPGSDAAGNAQVPSFQARFDGPGEGLGKEPGAHLHFLGAGMSLVTRREMLGVALAPNISFGRIDVSARFIAHIPIVYFPRRRSWRAASGFKIEILHFRADSSESASGQHAGTEALLRMLVQAVVEGVVKHLLVSALGPAFGEYLLGAQHGADVVMELVMQGVPIRTFDAPLGGPTDVSRHAALLLGLRQSEVARLLEVQSLIPPSAGTSFRSLADLMRYYHTTGMHHQPERRRQLAALWQELLDRLPNATAPPADMASVFERLAALAQKPAQVTLKVRALRLHVQLEAAVGAVCDGVAAHLACSGAEHGSAKTVRLPRAPPPPAALLSRPRHTP